MRPGASDQISLWLALGMPTLSVLALMDASARALGAGPDWPALLLTALSTLWIYGWDRWRDRGRAWPGFGWGALALGLGLVLSLGAWWRLSTAPSLSSVAYLCAGLVLSLGYAGFDRPWAPRCTARRGLKHLPGCKALVVAVGVSVAVLGMPQWFSLAPRTDAPSELWWPRIPYLLVFLAMCGANAQAFDLRDRAQDEHQGTPSLAVLLGPARAGALAFGWLWGLGALGLWLGRGPFFEGPAPLGLVACSLALGWMTARARAPWLSLLVLDGALVVPWCVQQLCLLLGLSYKGG